MTLWSQRSREERTLLNPAFCAAMLWYGARGCASVDDRALSLEEAFLLLPFVLHRGTREALPRSTRTSLTIWLEENPLARSQIISRARFLVPFTREGITFGGLHDFIRIEKCHIHAVEEWRKIVKRKLGKSSGEVRECMKKSEFIGKWFGKTGRPSTVFALMGARP